MPVVGGIDYTSQGGYNALTVATLISQFGGAFLTPAGTGPRLARIGNQLVAVDTSGKVMFIRGIMRATRSDGAQLSSGTPTEGNFEGQQDGRSLTSNIINKYPTTADWRDATGARLRSMHTFATGNTSDDFNLGGGLVVLFRTNAMSTAMTSTSIQPPGSEPIKDLMAATLQGGVGIVGRMFGDVFDPKYAGHVPLFFTVWEDPKIFAFWGDDGDHNSAFGGEAHQNEMAAAGHPVTEPGFAMHGGMAVLWGQLTGITAQNNPNVGAQTWSTDTLNHTKRALLDFLIARYGTIAALNMAWGTGGHYTSFEHVDGWGVGTRRGLADEDGAVARPWFGPIASGQTGGVNNVLDSTGWGKGALHGGVNGALVTSSFTGTQVTALKEDMDLFLYEIWKALLQPQYDHVKAVRPNALYAGPNGGAAGRAPVYKALNDYTDCTMGGGHFAFGNGHVLNPDAQAITDFMVRWYTKPFFTSIYNGNNRDSCLYYIGGDDGTQEQNGARTAQIIDAFMAYQTPAGIRPYIGVLEWGLYDQIGESAGWGRMSLNDNPYDGRDYRPGSPDVAPGADPYNAITGQTRTAIPEDRKYGDQITAIRQAYIGMYNTLLEQIGGTPSPEPMVSTPQTMTLAIGTG